ncbi:hypothetical protein DF152_17145 [Burkholderia cenocepacia]|nr:hypothetical protein DF152_17145 [Burkholderia cenocepacia]
MNFYAKGLFYRSSMAQAARSAAVAAAIPNEGTSMGATVSIVVTAPAANFTGAIAGNTLTVTGTDPNLSVGQTVTGSGVAASTNVTGVLGNGQYTVSGAAQTVASESMSVASAGVTLSMRPDQYLDFLSGFQAH